MATTLSTAQACANLLRLGYGPREAIYCAHEWARTYKRHGINSIAWREPLRLVRVNGHIELGHLYGATRMFGYAHVFRLLARSSKDRTLLCPVGENPTAFASNIALFSRLLGFRIRFMRLSAATLREIRSALCAGHNALLFVDAPWTVKTDRTCQAIPTEIGDFQTYPSASRLAETIDPSFKSVFTQLGRWQLDMTIGQGVAQYKAMITELAAHIARSPSSYELLPRLHRYWTLADGPSMLIAYRDRTEDILLHSPSMRCWSFPQAGNLSVTVSRFARSTQMNYNDVLIL